MKVTDEQIQELKAKYGKLYMVTNRGRDFVMRLPTLTEWREARKKTGTFAVCEKLVRTCIVFPTLNEFSKIANIDPVLEEALGGRLINYIISDTDETEYQEGTKIEEDGKEYFLVGRREKTYKFKLPSRANWKQISTYLGNKMHREAVDTIIAQCIVDVTPAELDSLMQNDVGFSDQVGMPLLALVVDHWNNCEGKEIV
jgi:hypothetical protein